MDPTPNKNHLSAPAPAGDSTAVRRSRHLDPAAPTSATHKILASHFPRFRSLPTKSAKSAKPQPQLPPADARSQAKTMSMSMSMSMSARADSSNNLFPKSSRRNPATVVEKQRIVAEKQKQSKSSLKAVKEKEEEEESNVEKAIVSLTVGGGRRRRSFDSPQIELADFLSCNGVKVVSVDMPPFMQIHAVDCARKARDSLEKFTSKALACTLKKEFDGAYGPAWHCVVGMSFGSFVTHSVGGFLYFSMDKKLYVLLFKTTVQRAD
ncbi:uncharacterized protein LOC131146278 [Malania oleifera]|uniref:uncharacterized protein LOC131146278 n=1 Tax=Malania oleifera TaxID=397392 RepID=UPI0025AE7802|nr:uncharacterized protein LOC131146278 [Malania oleifera]